MNATKRNPSLDIIRFIALSLVISIHYFLNISDFYNTPFTTITLHNFILIFIRTFSTACVPLFLLLTGYLMNKKELSISYYKGITKTIFIYIVVSILCYIHICLSTVENFSFKGLLLGITGFQWAKYSWYIEMYIGLFLLVPFLNLIYNNLSNKKEMQILIITLFALTVLPSILNIYNFTHPGWWSEPSSSSSYNKLIPEWWTSLYPITYYFLGCYIKEYNVKIKKIKNIMLLFFFVFAFSIFNYYRSFNHVYVWGSYQNWGGIQCVIISILLFVLILNIKMDNMKSRTKNILSKISNACLGAYLVSFIIDDLVYDFINPIVNKDPMKMVLFYLPTTVIVIIISLSISHIISYTYDAILLLISKINKKRDVDWAA